MQGILERRKRYIKGENGTGVLSRNVASLSSVVNVTIDRTINSPILLATDGFMRLVDVYNFIESIDELYTKAIYPGGLAGLLEMLRNCELSTNSKMELFKKSDDAAAAVIEVVL